MFRSLRDPEGNKLTHNFRPIQPLNNRIVLANSQHAHEPGYEPIFFDEPPAIKEPPITTEGSNIMDLTSTEQETTITYEVNDWSTTIRFVPAPVEPIRTTVATDLLATTTLGKVTFPDDDVTVASAEKEEEVVTHKTHKLDHIRGHGKGTGHVAVRAHPPLLSFAISTVALLITTNLLL